MKKYLLLLLLPVLALNTACGEKDPTAEDVAESCSDAFLLQYDVPALDTRYQATVDAADIYGIDAGAELNLDEEAAVCLDYKASYEAQQHAYESLELVVEAEADSDAMATGAVRVDRSLRWVTYEAAEEWEGTIPIAPGWVSFVALRGDGETWEPNFDIFSVEVGDDYIEKTDNDFELRISVAYPF